MVNFKHLDFLGQEPTLYFLKQDRYKTNCGAFLTITSFSASLALLIYFFVRVFNRNNPVAVDSRQFNDEKYLDYSNFQQIMLVTKEGGVLFEKDMEDKMFYLKLNYRYLESDEDHVHKEKSFTLKRCTKDDFGEYFYLFKDIPNLERYFCFPKELKIEYYGVYGGTKRFSYTQTAVKKCINSIDEQSNCLPEEEINKEMSGFYVNFAYIDFNIQNGNVASPGEPYVKQDRLQIGINLYKRFYYQISLIDYKTDFGYIFPDVQTNNFFSVSSFSLIPDLKIDNSLMSNTFSLSKTKITVLRSFEKIQEVLSNIGGAIKALTVMGKVTLYLVANNQYFFELSCLISKRAEIIEGTSPAVSTVSLSPNVRIRRLESRNSVQPRKIKLNSGTRMSFWRSILFNFKLFRNNELGLLYLELEKDVRRTLSVENIIQALKLADRQRLTEN